MMTDKKTLLLFSFLLAAAPAFAKKKAAPAQPEAEPASGLTATPTPAQAAPAEGAAAPAADQPAQTQAAPAQPAAPEKEAAPAKAAPAAKKGAANTRGDSGSQAPSGKAPASVDKSTAAAAGKGNKDLDVTITGEARDEISITKNPPPLDVPFKDVASLSREGETDRILSDEVQHMTLEDQTKLIEMNSRQTILPTMVRVPAPPFFHMEVPSALMAAGGANGPKAVQWEFQVVDQGNRIIKSSQGGGAQFPQNALMEWDGFDGGQMAVQVGPAYSPILLVTDAQGKSQRYFGDPIQLDALQYEQDGLLHLEFSNNRLYERKSANFSEEMEPMIAASLNVLRLRVGTPLRIAIFDDPAQDALSKKRLEVWKNFLLNQLMINSDDITVTTAPPGERGKITALMMLAKP